MLKRKLKTIALPLCLGVAFSCAANAGPADYVFTPTVEYGEREIDFKLGSAKQQDGVTRTDSSIGYGYGATEYWFFEIYLKQEQTGGSGLTLAEWENKFQLTETGKYPVDLGFIAELEAPLSRSAPWEVKIGPLLQTEFGKLQLNGNLLFERAFGQADESGVPFVTNAAYQWQIKYRWQPEFEFGMQGFGEMGEWDDWSKQADQSHTLGPAIFGKLPLGDRRKIKYNAAWLIGNSDAAPDNTLRMQVEYEF